jgi:hypothetical protein
MSVAYDKILRMNDKTETWFKWDYVCPNCDAHIEMIIKSNGHPHSEICSKCFERLTLMSVVDATINPTTKKEDEMETLTPAELYNPHQLVTYKKIAGTYALPEAPEYVTDKVTDIEWALDRARRDANQVLNDYEKAVALEEIIKENYVDSADQSTLLQIAELFNISLTKDVEFVATIEISGTVTVDLTDEDALQTLLENSVNVSSYDGDLDVSDYVLVNYEER